MSEPTPTPTPMPQRSVRTVAVLIWLPFLLFWWIATIAGELNATRHGKVEFRPLWFVQWIRGVSRATGGRIPWPGVVLALWMWPIGVPLLQHRINQHARAMTTPAIPEARIVSRA